MNLLFINRDIRLKKFCITVVVAAILYVFFAVVTHATSTKEQMESLAGELEDLKTELAQLEVDKAEVAQVQENTQNQIAVVEQQLDLLFNDISAKRADITTTRQEIDITKQELAQAKELLEDRLRYMYIYNNSSNLSVLLGVNNFSEFLVMADAMSRVAEADNTLIEEFAELSADLALREEALSAQLIDLEAQERTLQEKNEEYANTLMLANEELSQIEAETAATQLENDKILEQYNAAKAQYEEELRQLIENSTGTEYIGEGYAWPVPGYPRITSGFGPRILLGRPDDHNGIDVGTEWSYQESINGKNIVASNSGKVVKAIYSDYGYGIYVMVDHGGGNLTLYGHCSSLLVSSGEVVVKGQPIATVGDTGNSTAPHLHFEIIQNGARVNPEPLLPAYGDR